MATRCVMVAAAVAVSGLALAGPVLASPASRHVRGRWSARSRLGAATHAPNFAGYLVGGGESSVSMNTTIVLPKLKCGGANEGIEAGTGGYYPPGSVTDLSAAGMFVGCHGGKARYYPAFTLNAVNKNYPKLRAKAGDTVVLNLVMISSGTRLSVTDKTTKSVKKTLTGSGVSGVDGSWAGDSEYPATKFSAGPVPVFGNVTFSDTMFGGFPIGDIIGITRYDRYRGNTLQIATGPVTDQDVFTTVFKHS